MLIEDIAPDPEPEAASPSPTVEAPARARQYACHHAKIDKVVTALEADGLLPPELRPVVRNRRIIDALMAAGFALDLPSPWAIRRYFESRQRARAPARTTRKTRKMTRHADAAHNRTTARTQRRRKV